MGRRSETGGVKPAGNRIEVRFTWQGKEIRPTLALKPNAANLAHARRLREEQIMPEIAAGTFSLAKHFPAYKFREKHEPEATDGNRTFVQWGNLWAKLAARELEHSTIKIYRTHLAAYWTSVWGELVPRRITHEMVLTRLADLASERFDEAAGKTRKGLSRKTQNNILIPLRAVFALICKGTGQADPTEGINCLKVQTGKPDPFTLEEVDLILADLRKPRGKMTQAQADALADYYEFAGFAGPRPSEQIALRWVDIDFRKQTAFICRASVLRQVKERTKTHASRTVELNSRAWAVIDRQRARTQLAGPLVFMNPFTGLAWNTGEEQRREWKDCLRRVGVRHRPPKELRDTSVTQALMAGCDPYWVAAQHGHSIQTMQKDYAKWMPKGDRGRNLAAMNQALGTANKGDERGTG